MDELFITFGLILGAIWIFGDKLTKKQDEE
jgi:hypothetical protein